MKRLIALLLCAWLVPVWAGEAPGQVIDTLTTQTTTATGTTWQIPQGFGLRTHFCSVAGTGAISATILAEGSNTGATGTFATLATLSPSGTTSATDAIVTQADWPYMRHRISAISGTGATVNCTAGFGR